MTQRTAYLRSQTLSGANKCMRRPMPAAWSTAELPLSLPERKAAGFKKICEEMPLFIGKQELIVGTRTYFTPNPGNEDGHDVFAYSLGCGVSYVNKKEIELFGTDGSWVNITHYTPDYSILLEKGIGGIIADAVNRGKDAGLKEIQKDFLNSLILAYEGLQTLILRYSHYAERLEEEAPEADKRRLREIAQVCKNISNDPPHSFYEAVQLLWFGHLGMILESFEFINYGRLDVILGRYLGDTPHEDAQQILECLLMKMYDQVDLQTTYLNKYAAQLVVTLGGVLTNGENAVNEVTMLFLDAIDNVRFPEPEFNLRINSKNPPAFLNRAIELTISGCNFVSYYNDDLFIESMIRAGLPVEYARNYGFDLCQDINIPGYGDFYVMGIVDMAPTLMELLEETCNFETFDQLLVTFKDRMRRKIDKTIAYFNQAEEHLFMYRDEKYDEYFSGIRDRGLPIDLVGRCPMCPLPLLSGVFHGTIENAMDVVFESYPLKEKGVILGIATEAVNSLAAIKKVVFENREYSLQDVYQACEQDFQGKDLEVMRNILWNAPKWGNDDDFVDDIAVDVFTACLEEIEKHRTFSGGHVLGGIHQPHPVITGESLSATPEGRHARAPVAVTLTPENGSMRNGPTAALQSACKIPYELIQWNFCVMVNYVASVFAGNKGHEVFKDLLLSYFENGGLQHQPNILDVQELKQAQLTPEKYKDLIVRLWGVSAHFVDLPKELQDEVIARFN